MQAETTQVACLLINMAGNLLGENGHMKLVTYTKMASYSGVSVGLGRLGLSNFFCQGSNFLRFAVLV